MGPRDLFTPPELMPGYRASIAFRGEPDPVTPLKIALYDLCARNRLFWLNQGVLSTLGQNGRAYGPMLEIAMRAASANPQWMEGENVSPEAIALVTKIREDLKQLQEMIGDVAAGMGEQS